MSDRQNSSFNMLIIIVSHHSRHLEGRSDLLHLGFVLLFGLFSSVLHSTEDRIRDDLDVFLEKLGIKREREEFTRTVDLHFNGAATARDFKLFGFELGLERLDLTLHFLGLFEEFTDAGPGI